MVWISWVLALSPTRGQEEGLRALTRGGRNPRQRACARERLWRLLGLSLTYGLPAAPGWMPRRVMVLFCCLRLDNRMRLTRRGFAGLALPRHDAARCRRAAVGLSVHLSVCLPKRAELEAEAWATALHGNDGDVVGMSVCAGRGGATVATAAEKESEDEQKYTGGARHSDEYAN